MSELLKPRANIQNTYLLFLITRATYYRVFVKSYFLKCSYLWELPLSETWKTPDTAWSGPTGKLEGGGGESAKVSVITWSSEPITWGFKHPPPPSTPVTWQVYLSIFFLLFLFVRFYDQNCTKEVSDSGLLSILFIYFLKKNKKQDKRDMATFLIKSTCLLLSNSWDLCEQSRGL